MKAETEALLQQCREALLDQSDERIAALLTQWFENMIGDDGVVHGKDADEQLDDLCLQLGYRVQTHGSQISYATYTSWWEVEGYLEPSEGVFACANLASLRQRLHNMPIKQFDVIMELAFQMRSMMAELDGHAGPSIGQPGLREMIRWLELGAPESWHNRQVDVYTRGESKEQQRRRDRELGDQACRQGYIIVYPETSQAVTDNFRSWCKKQAYPYIWIYRDGQPHVTLRIQTKTVDRNTKSTELARFQEQLPTLAAPYIAKAKAQGHQVSLAWTSKKQAVLENILVVDAEEAAQALVALWSGILAEEKQRAIEREAARQAALEPMWKRELKRLSEQKQQPEIPLLAPEVILPKEWEASLTREELAAFLSFLKLPASAHDVKAGLVQRLQERLETDQVARAWFFEIFKRELAVPPWELETLLACTTAERKRWTEEGRLPVVDQRSFRKGGSAREYPFFDRRVNLSLPHA